ncbi:MAG: DUF128 domain-containing protein [Candidatus Altiarchaeota archaeon]|nr:DUF128 domain-containing protein [Candidatus Altiarchaeota archaeon]
MEIVTDRTEYEILSVLDRKNRAVTSAEIERELQKIGIDLSRRRITQYLELLDSKGFSENHGRDGRLITAAGKEEKRKAMVHTKLNYVIDEIIQLSTEMSFDLEKKKGNVVANLSLFDAEKETEVFKLLEKICMDLNFAPPFVATAHEGEDILDYRVPEGKMALITISSTILDGIFLNSGIYTIVKYGGMAEFFDKKPQRFVYLVPTKDCSVDPFEDFLLKGMTEIRSVAETGHGFIPVDYREYPGTSILAVRDKLRKIAEIFGGLYLIGKPAHPFLGVLPTENYAGVSALGGEFLIFALGEYGITSDTRFVFSLIDFKELRPIVDVTGEVISIP